MQFPSRVRSAATLSLVLAAASLGRSGRAAAEAVQASASRIMIVVAHQDDDIMVTVPDLVGALRERRALQTVYLTSGDAGFTCDAYTQGREQGAKAQQALLAGVPNQWTDSEHLLLGKRIRLSRLHGTLQSMVFLGLPNPALFSRDPPEGAIQKLWRRQITQVSTLPYDGRGGGDSYTREELIEVLKALMTRFGADDVRVLDASQQQIPIYPFEHVDHMGSAMFAMAALQRYAGADSLTFYPLYSVLFQPANLPADMSQLRRDMLAAYRPHDAKMCPTAVTTICQVSTTCDPMTLYDPLWPRHYPADIIRGASKQLKSPRGLCLDVVESAPRLRACDPARFEQRWTLGRGGVVHNDANRLCLAASSAHPGHAVSMRQCVREPAQQFYLTTQKQLRGPDATCVSDDHGDVGLAECAVDDSQLGWLTQ